MRLAVIAVGKMKEPGARALCAEYAKRLTRYARLELIELPDLPEPPSPALEKQVMDREGEAILRQIRPGDYVIALTIPGEMCASPELARRLEALAARTPGRLVFVVGGSLGLGEAVLRRADAQLSMSPMTFPHQLARVMLLEQLYRCCKISAGERYHK